MWINDLADYYSHAKKVPDIRIEMLFKRFKDNESAELARAVDLYINDSEYFPSVSSFRPYVEKALHQVMIETTKRSDWFTDDDLYEWELARGTMRSMVDIDTEIAEARTQLKEMT